jgi:hypothetical protein
MPDDDSAWLKPRRDDGTKSAFAFASKHTDAPGAVSDMFRDRLNFRLITGVRLRNMRAEDTFRFYRFVKDHDFIQALQFGGDGTFQFFVNTFAKITDDPRPIRKIGTETMYIFGGQRGTNSLGQRLQFFSR